MTKAKIGKEIITLEEVEQAQLEQQREALLSQQIERLIAKRLLASCARRHGLTVEALLEVEVQGKAAEVMEAEITTFIDQNRARLRGEEAKLRPQIRHHLRTQKIAQQGQAYVQALRARANVTVDQEEMKTTRVWASPDKGVARGLATAPVTIVEFADCQCPFGKSVLPTIKQVMDRYPGRVRWVFRDFPIAGLHPTAPRAHEAARCAAAQGRFWEYHDLLYERSPRHAPDELKQYAQELKLNGATFAACLDGETFKAEVNQDVEEGLRPGVSGAPTFFINGRVLVGLQPLVAFETLIEQELAKTVSR